MGYPSHQTRHFRGESSSRGRGGFTRGGGNDMRKRPTAILSTGGIFDNETPKAYAPLGYTIPEKPKALKPEDFNNDSTLPMCPTRPSNYITTPLGPTFLDTESQKPTFQGSVNRRQIPRDNTIEIGGIIDPTVKLVRSNLAKKTPLTLGKQIISENNLETGGGTIYLERMLKRERDNNNQEPRDEKEVKRQKRDFRIKFDGEAEGDINDDTVKPENVLRMVDQSLVENTPEKKQEEYQRRPVPVRKYYDEYDNFSREREFQRDRERAREREREPNLRDRDPREYNVREREPYPYKYRDYKIPPTSAPHPTRSVRYYDDYERFYPQQQQQQQMARPVSAGNEYYDYYDRRYPYPYHPPPPQPVVERRGGRDYEYDYALPHLPPPPPMPMRESSPDYRRYERRSESSSRRFDDRRRY